MGSLGVLAFDDFPSRRFALRFVVLRLKDAIGGIVIPFLLGR